MTSGLACWFFLIFFFTFFLLDDNSFSAVAEVTCALSRINSMEYWDFKNETNDKEKKKSCDNVSWLRTSLWQTLCFEASQQTLEKNRIYLLMFFFFRPTSEVHVLALNFYDTSLWTNVCPRQQQRKKICKRIKKKKVFVFFMWGNWNELTSCLVAKCALISVRYTFLTHSHTWEYEASGRGRGLKWPLKNLHAHYVDKWLYARMCDDFCCTLYILGNHCLLWFLGRFC